MKEFIVSISLFLGLYLPVCAVADPVKSATSSTVPGTGGEVLRAVAGERNAAGSGLLPMSPRLRSSAALQIFEDEPDISQVQQWAIENARLSPFEAQRLVRQARLRGALPSVRLHARYRSESSTKWDELDLVDGRGLDSDLSINLWLEWDLAELAAGIDMARALRESRARLELRHAVVSQVTSDYFDRRLLRAEEQLAGDDAAAVILGRRLRVQELNATLDGLTGGRWSRALRSESSEPPGEDSHPGLRVPVHATDRPADP